MSNNRQLSATEVFLPTQPGQRPVFVYCTQCWDVHAMSPYDGLPSYRGHGEKVEEEPDQTRTAFLERHRNHPLRSLKPRWDRIWANSPAWDPLRTAYMEVTDRSETFLVKSWRTNPYAPRQYALLRGSLDLTKTVRLPAQPLHDVLVEEIFVSTISPSRLVQLLQRAVATLPPDEMIPAYFSAEDPHVMFAHLTDYHLGWLARRCAAVDVGTELGSIRTFFREQQSDALMVEVRNDGRPRLA